LATKEEQRLSREEAWSMGSVFVMGSAMEASEVNEEGAARLNILLPTHLTPGGAGGAEALVTQRVEGVDLEGFEGGSQRRAGSTNARIREPWRGGRGDHLGAYHVLEGGDEQPLELTVHGVHHRLRSGGGWGWLREGGEEGLERCEGRGQD
jgi:hypothetical protein